MCIRERTSTSCVGGAPWKESHGRKESEGGGECGRDETKKTGKSTRSVKWMSRHGASMVYLSCRLTDMHVHTPHPRPSSLRASPVRDLEEATLQSTQFISRGTRGKAKACANGKGREGWGLFWPAGRRGRESSPMRQRNDAPSATDAPEEAEDLASCSM